LQKLRIFSKSATFSVTTVAPARRAVSDEHVAQDSLLLALRYRHDVPPPVGPEPAMERVQHLSGEPPVLARRHQQTTHGLVVLPKLLEFADIRRVFCACSQSL
jgi:hypothetical protein